MIAFMMVLRILIAALKGQTLKSSSYYEKHISNGPLFNVGYTVQFNLLRSRFEHLRTFQG